MRGDLSEQLSPAQTIEREALHKAFRDVLATASGKRVLFWVLERAAIYEDPDQGEFTHATSTIIGRQKVGRLVMAKLDEIDPMLYPALLIAMNDIRETDKAAAEALAEKMEPEDDAEAI
jgi:hypothetical protein